MSAPFDLAVTSDHEIVVTATVDDPVNDPVPVPLRVDDGSITVDATAATRRTCSNVVVSDPNLTPTGATSLLAPNRELTLSRGVRYQDGTTEMYPLGVFVITKSQVEDTKDGVITTLSGADRSRIISRNTWDWPYQTVGDLGNALLVLIRGRLPLGYPNDVFNFALTTNPPINLPTLLYGTSDSDNDPWNAAQQMAASGGMTLYVDASGRFTLRPVTDLNTQAATWFVGDGHPVRPLSASSTMDGDKTYTRVFATAASTSLATPLRSIAELPSSSPLTFRYSTSAVTTQAQLDQIAQALLSQYSRAYRDVDFEVVPDPRVDVDQVIQLDRPALGLQGKYLLQKFTLGLKPDATLQATVQGGNL